MDFNLDWMYVFLASYTINLLYISVFYHRGLAHGSVEFSVRIKAFIIKTGPWVIGLDALTWTCMHRMHHLHSDTKHDPHSPHYMGHFSLIYGQLLSYTKIMIGLIKQRPNYTVIVADLNSEVHWLYRYKLWWLPYLFHILISYIIGLLTNDYLISLAYLTGIMSHPIQGWLVNAFAHSRGYRNYNTPDKSVNNLFLGWFVFGEGYQNNHHKFPQCAKFGVKWWEIDLGYFLCLICKKLQILKMPVQNEINKKPVNEAY